MRAKRQLFRKHRADKSEITTILSKQQIILALLIAVGMFSGSLQAQQAKAKLPGQRILYVRHLPGAVRRHMPHGAKSRFFGSFKVAAQPMMALHLYNDAAAPTGLAYDQSFTVDIFEAKGQSKAQYHLLQSFPVQYTGWGWAPEKFGVQLLWLDPQQRHQPIIKIDCINNGEYGPSGDNVLLIFPQGLSSKPVTQSFNFGAWRSSSTSGESNSFESVDEHGLLQISQQIYLATGEVPTPPPVIWRWNGKEFAPVTEIESVK